MNSPLTPASEAESAQDKKHIRALLQHSRVSRPLIDRDQLNARIVEHALDLIAEVGARKISAYFPLAEEPGGPSFVETLSAVVDEVWLPLSRPHGLLEWARYEGPNSIVRGAYGIAEPATTPCSSDILSTLDLLLIPALGAHSSGRRIGKGAGYYDRALASLTPHSPCQAILLYSEEIRTDIPFEDHDAIASCAITEKGVMRFPTPQPRP